MIQDLLLSRASYLAIVAILALSGVGLPLPEEVIVVSAGVLSSPAMDVDSRLIAPLAFLACLVGAIVGDCIMYWLGRIMGKAFLREHPWFQRILPLHREEQIEEMIRTNGMKVFLLARFLVGFRSPIYFVSGILHIPFRRFLLVDGGCALLVISIFFWISYFTGNWLAEVVHQSQVVVTLIILVLILTVGIHFGWKKYRRVMLSRRQDAPSQLGEPAAPGAETPGQAS